MKKNELVQEVTRLRIFNEGLLRLAHAAAAGTVSPAHVRSQLNKLVTENAAQSLGGPPALKAA